VQRGFDPAAVSEVYLKRCRRVSPAGGLGVSPGFFNIPARMGGARGVEPTVAGNSAAECCRESEGVPQILSFSYPPRLGDKGG
jgi:hypothetical protein